ncbi:MAG: LLM class flavin-dependent oxidoreductase [Chloroflexota bacterium]|nr:LLM class flavin-dependent oxidoreductase [Chloroflexota bacterium]
MKLGILVETEEGLDWSAWRATYRAAERLGFESIWLSDHLASSWSAGRHGLEPWVALSVAAAETRRVRLGPLVSPITFRQPAVVARMAEALDDVSQGRFVLGLGLGWNADEHAQFGIPFPPLSARVDLLRQGIERIRGVLGKRHVPVLIGGSGPRSTLPLVARYADEWNLTTASLDVYHTRSRRLAELCEELGRDPGTIRRSVAAGCLIGHDEADLDARGRRLQRLVPPLARPPDQTDSLVEEARGIGWVAGTPTEIVAMLRPLADAGVRLAILGHYDLRDEAALELIASDVMPELA